MYGVGAPELVILVIGLLSTIIPLAILIWLIVSVQGLKKSLRSIEKKLSGVDTISQVKAE